MQTNLIFGKKSDAVIQQYLRLSKNNRLAIGILLPDGEIGKYTSYGVENDSLFDIGSISKTFTAQVILKLSQEGKISLLDTVDKFLPLPKGEYPTVERLLTHRAGYTRITPVGITLPRLIRKSYKKANPYRLVEEKDVIKALEKRSKKRRSAPRYAYSDFSYAVLGIIASRITGKNIPELLYEIMRGYNMSDTCVLAKTERVPCLIGRKVVAPWQWTEGNPYIASGGIVSTLSDMILYAKAQVEGTYSFTQKAQCRCEQSFNKFGIGTCLGWHTYKRSNQCWHVGAAGAFRSCIIFNAKLKCAVVVLSNARGARNANAPHLAKVLYGEIKRRHVKVDQ